MDYIILIREYRYNDSVNVNQLVRNVYLSNVTNTWLDLIFREITFQLIVLTAAVMFIFLGVPPLYCILAAPIVLIGIFVSTYCSLLMKAMEVIHSKRPIQSWVAEVYEPYFFTENPQNCSYKIVFEEKQSDYDLSGYQKKIIGTVAVMNHNQSANTAWLFRFAVDKRYYSTDVRQCLIKTVQFYCRRNNFLDMQLALSEHNESERQLFVDCGFQTRLMYHKQLLGSALTMVMYHLEYDLDPDL